MYLKKSIILVSLIIVGVYSQGPPNQACNNDLIEKCNVFTNLLKENGDKYGGCRCYQTQCYIDTDMGIFKNCAENQTKACSDFCEKKGNECYKYLDLKTCENGDKKDKNGECWIDNIKCSMEV